MHVNMSWFSYSTDNRYIFFHITNYIILKIIIFSILLIEFEKLSAYSWGEKILFEDINKE